MKYSMNNMNESPKLEPMAVDTVSPPEPSKLQPPRYHLKTNVSLFSNRDKMCNSLMKDLKGLPFDSFQLFKALQSAATDRITLSFLDTHADAIRNAVTLMDFMDWLRIIDRPIDDANLLQARRNSFNKVVRIPTAKSRYDICKVIEDVSSMAYLDEITTPCLIRILAHGPLSFFNPIMCWLLDHADDEPQLDFFLYQFLAKLDAICPDLPKSRPIIRSGRTDDQKRSNHKKRQSVEGNGPRNDKGIAFNQIDSSYSLSTHDPCSFRLTPVDKPEQSLPVLFDTGASCSFMSTETVKRLGLPMKWCDARSLRLTFGSTEFTTVLHNPKLSTFSFRLTDQRGIIHQFQYTFVVLQNLSCGIILGSNFLEQFKVTLDFSVAGQPTFLIGETPKHSVTNKAVSDQIFPRSHEIAKCESSLQPAVPIASLHAATTIVNIEPPGSLDMETKIETLTVPQPIKAVLSKHKAVFGPVETLPPARPTDYRLKLDQTAYDEIKCRPLPKYNLNHLQFIEAETRRLLDAGMIEPSNNRQYSVPMVVPKPRSQKLRMVIDFRQLNDVTEQTPTTLPPWNALISDLHGPRFTTLDLTSGYNLLRVHPETRKFLTFLTPRGKFQYKVLPFGISEAPRVFSQFLSGLLFNHSKLRNVRQYMDDLLIPGSSDPVEYSAHLDDVLTVLEQNHLKLNFEKCRFYEETVPWVGHQISKDGISPQDDSVHTIRSIGRPNSKTEVKQLLGHFGYYQEHMADYANQTIHLTNLLKKNHLFNWSPECETEFQQLKRLIIHQLQSFDPLKPCVICCDASKFAVGAVLLQQSTINNTSLRPVAFRSRKFRDAETNWDIHDKEIFAVVYALEKFQFFVDGRPTTIYTDQSSIKDIFNNDKLALTPKHQRWLARIVSFDVTIKHVAGESNVIADHLSRRPDWNEDDTLSGPSTETVTLQNIVSSVSLADSYPEDKYFGPIFHQLSNSTQPENQEETYSHYELRDNGTLYYDGRLCIPETALQEFLDHMHSSVIGGHIGTRRMLARVRARYYFPKLTETVSNYVASCSVCHQVKSRNHHPHGLLELPPIPTQRWSHLHVDLITGLPRTLDPIYRTLEYDAILTVVDRLSSRCHFIPTQSSLSTQGLLQLLMIHVFRLHGFPQVIQSDRGPQFDNELYREFLSSLGCKVYLGVSHHQQSNGKAERFNALIEDYIRCYVGNNTDWIRFLAIGEFVLNSAPSTSLKGLSAFEVDIGCIPNHPTDIVFPSMPEAFSLSEKLDRLLQTARQALQLSREKYKENFDKSHTDVTFAVGDEVYVDNSVFSVIPDARTQNLAPKLRGKFCGPFRVAEKLSDLNYRLELPPSSHANSVFHASQLRSSRKLPDSCVKAPNAPIVFKRYQDGSEEMEIKRIMGHQKKTKGYSMLVQFTDNTEQWVRASSLRRSATELLEDYISRNGLSSLRSP